MQETIIDGIPEVLKFSGAETASTMFHLLKELIPPHVTGIQVGLVSVSVTEAFP